MHKRMMTGTTRSGHTSRHASPAPGGVTTPTTNSSWVRDVYRIKGFIIMHVSLKIITDVLTIGVLCN